MNENDEKYGENIKIISEQLGNLTKQFSSPEWQRVIENQRKFVASIGSAIVNIVQSEAVQAMGRLAESMREYAIKLPKIEFSEETKDIFRRIAFLNFLSDIQWPLFLIDDEKLREKLSPYMSDVSGNFDMESIQSRIYDYMDNGRMASRVKSWENSTVIDLRRIPILQEAFELYEEERYYGCVSILICQLEGIITETYQMQIDNGVEFTLEDIKEAYEHYNPDKTFPKDFKVKNEKSKLLCMVTETQGGIFCWIKVVEYIYNIVLTSNEEMNQSNHPCRNKICHGIQLNYGTKEHAMKALLSVDMVINLAEEMRRVIEVNAKKDGEETE